MRDHQRAEVRRECENQGRMGNNKWIEESNQHTAFILENVLLQVPVGSILELQFPVCVVGEMHKITCPNTCLQLNFRSSLFGFNSACKIRAQALLKSCFSISRWLSGLQRKTEFQKTVAFKIYLSTKRPLTHQS